MDFFTLHQRHPTQRARLMRSMHRLAAIVTIVMTIAQAAGVDGSAAVFAVPRAEAATGIFAPINYQGKISAINGAAVADGKYNMRFKIFNAATGGVPLWTETWNNTTQQVTMTGGLFSVALGSQVAMTGSVDFNSDNLYLQVEFDPSNNGTYPEVFSPRRRFGSVPYAHNADSLDGLNSTQFIRNDESQTASGTLTIKPNDASKIGLDILSTGGTTASPGLRISTNGAPDIVFGSGGANYDVNLYRFTANVLKTDSSFYVAGELSGSTVHAEKTLTTSGGLVFEGAASGSSLFLGTSLKGAGLTDCSTGTTSKLLWNSSTGRFSCGTDQSGGLNSTGQVLTIGDARYVKKSGDTMTGTLNIRPTAGASTVGLNIAATMSGRALVIEGTGGSPLIYTDLTHGRIGFGTTTPSSLLELNGNISFSKDGAVGVSPTMRFISIPSQTSAGISGNSMEIIPGGSPNLTGNAGGGSLYLLGGTSLSQSGKGGNVLIGGGQAADDGTGGAGSVYVYGGKDTGSGKNGNVILAFSGSSALGNVAIGKSIARTQLDVGGAISGSTIYGNNSVNSSGSITAEGAISGASLFVGTSINGAGLSSCNSTNSALQWDSSTGRFSCGTITSGTSFSTGQVITIGDARYVKKSGDTMTGALVINVTNGSPGTIGLKVLNTLTGAILHAEKNLTSSGTLAIHGIATFQNNVNVAGTLSGAALTIMSGNSYLLGNVGIGKSGTPNSKLEVVGTMSGSVIYGNNSVNSSGSITAEGAISGASLFVGTSIKGAGLSSCNSTNNALQWNSSTGRFSCGSMSGTTNSGNVIAIGDSRYVKKSGDTMTGALNIRPTAGSNTTGLNVAATMSGRSLVVEGTGSQPLLTTSIQYGSILMGTGSVKTGTGFFQPQLDIAGRVATTYIGSATTGTSPVAIAVQNRYAYVVNEGANTLQVFDASNPSAPVLMGSVATGTVPIDIAVQGQYAYVVNYNDNTLQIYNIANPSAPLSLGTITTDANPFRLTVNGRYAYVNNFTGNSMEIFDISNPATPVLRGRIATGSGPYTVSVQGNYAYVINHDGNTLQVFDVSHPNAPVSLGTKATGTHPFAEAVQGRYAYVVNNGSDTLQIFDVSNPASPVAMGSGATKADPQAISVQGRYAYVANLSSHTLQVFDISNPRIPVSVGTMSTTGGAYAMTLQGRYAYVTDTTNNALRIFDLGGAYIQGIEAGSLEAASLTIRTTIQGIDEELQGGLTIGQSLFVNGNASFGTGGLVTIGGNTGSVLNARGTISGSTIYATNALRSSGSITAEGTISGANLFVGTSIKGAGLVDCSNSTTSKLLWNSSTGRFSCGTDQTGGGTSFSTGQVLTIGDARYVKKSGDTMTGALNIRPTAGVNTVGLNIAATMSGRALTIEGTGSFALVTTSVQYGTILMGTGSVKTGTGFFQPQLNIAGRVTSHFTGSGATGTKPYSISLQGRYAYIVNKTAATLQVFDVSNPVKPQSIGSVSVGGTPIAVVVAGKYAYTIDNTNDNLSIVDVSNPASPIVRASVSTFMTGIQSSGAPSALTVQGRYAYVGTSNATFSRFEVFDVSNPNLPRRVASPLNAVYNAQSISIEGNYAYVVDGSLGNKLAVVNISDPTNPVSVTTVNTGTSPVALAVQGRYAYVLDTVSNALQIFDISNPASPVLTGSGITASGPMAVAVAGRYAYVANNTSNSLQIFDVSNPSVPVVVGSVTTGRAPQSIAVGGRYALVVNSTDNSLETFDLGGGYIQSLEAGTLEAASLNVRGDIEGMDLALQGGEVIAGSLLVNGNASFGSGGLVLIGSMSGTVLWIRGTASGSIVHAGNALTSSGQIIVKQSGTSVGSGALTVVNKTRTGTGIYAFSSGAAVLALEAGTQSGSKTPDILFGYKGTFDTSISRTSTGALTFRSNTGVLLTLNTGMTNAKQDVFRIISQVSDAHGSPPNNLVFRVNGSGAVYSDATYNSNGADYAEWFYDGNDNLQSGEVVCIDVTRNNAVKRCSRDGDNDVTGVVSTHPAFIGNTITGAEGLMPPGYVLVGLIGQVPTRVMVSGTGAIQPGDQLTAASTPGYARKAMPGESTLGVALESIDHGTGVINVLISRRNSSMTVDAVSQKVLDTIASMKIGDEVQTMVAGAVQNLNVNDQVDSEVQKQISNLQATSASIQTLQGEIDALKRQLSTLSNQQAAAGSGSGAGAGSGSAAGSGTTSNRQPATGNLSASTLDLQKTLSVGGDARIAGDLHLDGALDASDIFVPGGIRIDGPETVAGGLEAATLHADSGAEVDGTLTINGSVRISSGSLLFGSGAMQLSDLIVSHALTVIGNITINGLATFLGDVSVKGELSISNRQAGFAKIPKTGTSVTVLFGSGSLTNTPVVTASPNVPVLYAVNKTTQTGFTIQLAEPAPADVTFSWIALTADSPLTQSGAAGSGMIFPLASDNIPVSSDMVWNACIRNVAMFDASGKAISCSRYHDAYTWHQPDLGIDFLWNTDLTPPLLLVPNGYVTKVTEDAAQLRADFSGPGNDGADTSVSPAVSSASSQSSNVNTTLDTSSSSSSSSSSDTPLSIEPLTTDGSSSDASVSSAASKADDAGSAASATSSAAPTSSIAATTNTTGDTSSRGTADATSSASLNPNPDPNPTSSAPATSDSTTSSAESVTTGTDAGTQTQ